MKIVTWNCSSRFADKAHLIDEMGAQLAIIQECSSKDVAALEREGYSALWFGSNPQKGLAVFSAGPWKIQPIAQPENTWIAPILVSGPTNFVLLAIWAWHNTSKRYAGYVEQLYTAFENHPEWFNRYPVVAAGDFNSSAKFNKYVRGNNHSTVVSLLEDQGLTSAYHHLHSRRQGEETVPTFHQMWKKEKPFYIDYIFIPNEWTGRMKSMHIGAVDAWIKHSDHCPLSVEFTNLSQ